MSKLKSSWICQFLGHKRVKSYGFFESYYCKRCGDSLQ